MIAWLKSCRLHVWATCALAFFSLGYSFRGWTERPMIELLMGTIRVQREALTVQREAIEKQNAVAELSKQTLDGCIAEVQRGIEAE